MKSKVQKNLNLSTITDSQYRGLDVIRTRGPLIVEYLDAIYEVLQNALAEYRRVLVVRCDLRLPAGYKRTLDSKVITRFISSLKAKLDADYARKKKQNGRCHPCTLRFVRVREQPDGEAPHYHVALILNRDRFHRVGLYNSERRNLATQIKGAWASALKLEDAGAGGSVHFPKHGCYELERYKDGYCDEFRRAFYRLSYLAKEATKRYGNAAKLFGRSQS